MLSASALYVTEEIKAAIIDVRDRLDRGELVHIDDAAPYTKGSPSNGFNMCEWFADGSHHECGTVGCIGGWAKHFHDIDFDVLRAEEDEYELPGGLQQLLFPDALCWEKWGEITPADSVKAINNWLDTNNPQWETIRPDLHDHRRHV